MRLVPFRDAQQHFQDNFLVINAFCVLLFGVFFLAGLPGEVTDSAAWITVSFICTGLLASLYLLWVDLYDASDEIVERVSLLVCLLFGGELLAAQRLKKQALRQRVHAYLVPCIEPDVLPTVDEWLCGFANNGDMNHVVEVLENLREQSPAFECLLESVPREDAEVTDKKNVEETAEKVVGDGESPEDLSPQSVDVAQVGPSPTVDAALEEHIPNSVPFRLAFRIALCEWMSHASDFHVHSVQHFMETIRQAISIVRNSRPVADSVKEVVAATALKTDPTEHVAPVATLPGVVPHSDDETKVDPATSH
jgi:hypothetical protein